MTNKKITDDQQAPTPLDGDEIIPVVQGGQNKRITVGNILDQSKLVTELDPTLGGDLDLNGHSIKINDVGFMGETTANIGVVGGHFAIESILTRDLWDEFTEETKVTVSQGYIAVSHQNPVDEINSGSASMGSRGVQVIGPQSLPHAERITAFLRKEGLSFSVSGPFGPPSLTGIVSGLADPTETHHAATKGYVDENTVASNPSGVTGATAISNIIQLSQANYDAIDPKDPATLYVIV